MVNVNPVRRNTALVTGASGGIGREFARVLAEHGYNVVLVARRIERLEELGRELEQRYRVSAISIQADLAEPNAAKEIYSELRRKEIEVEVLVNNAGFNVYGPFVETDSGDEMRMIQVNLVGLVALTKLFVRDMVRRGSGRILNLGSTGSFAPAPFDSLYAASKAFVLSFSEAVAEELKGTGVSVTVLCPGPTRTEFAAAAGMSDTKIFSGRLMSAEEVVSIGYSALMRGQTTVIAGLANKIQVWSMRFAPRALVARIAKGLMSRRPVPRGAGAHHA
jgi:short-subunit dehydrogenase